MEGKLNKYKNEYILSAISNGWTIGSTDHEYVSNHKGEQIVYKLSKQNCDELFGVVDVEKLAENHPLDVSNASHGFGIKDGIVYGFNKAMELNKDKVFTLEDMYDAVMLGVCFEDSGIQGISTYEELKELAIKRALKPTEIEVEIEVTKSDDIKSVEKDWYKIGEPKLDENGCLILKRI
jgi:hypothetical protein